MPARERPVGGGAARAPRSTRTFTLAATAFTIGLLYFAQAVLIPFALAALLSFLLAPLASRLERWVGRILSVILVVVLLLGAFAGFGWLVYSSLFDLAVKLPQYKDNIQKKVRVLRPEGESPLSRASETLEEIGKELVVPESAPPLDPSEADEPEADASAPPGRPKSSPESAAEPGAPRPRAAPPGLAVPVRVVEPPRSPSDYIATLLGPILGPLGTAGLVLIYVIFILLDRVALRDRLIRLGGRARISVTTQALDDAAQRVSRYLRMQLIVNATYGLPVAVGLFFIGVPNAILWGLLATVLRFIPYVGPWLAASMPIALSLAVFDDWQGPLLTIGLFVVLELISNNVMEPWLYGSSTGVSSLAIILAAVFWTWLWGAVGLVLATPLTVCLAVIGRHVPQMELLHILLSDESGLPPESRLYQRLLSMDPEEAQDVAEEFLRTHPLEQLYGEILLPVLKIVELDYHRGTLSESAATFVLQSIRGMVEELGSGGTPEPRGELVEPELPADAGPGLLPQGAVCLPARDEADEIAGLMLAQLLERRGLRALNVEVGVLAGEMLEAVGQHAASVVFVSVVPPSTVTHARYLCKRLRQRFPELRIVVGLWGVESPKPRERMLAAGANAVVSSLEQALAHLP
jgi:predicted PurR-regulated permease PerM